MQSLQFVMNTALQMEPAKESTFRILVVDDDEFVAQALALLLANHEVTLAIGGHEAMECLEREHSYDVIISDVQMPGMSGPTLCALARERWPSLARRFIFMSGNHDFARRAIRDCVSELQEPEWPILLDKPFSRHDLNLALSLVAAPPSPGYAEDYQSTELACSTD